MKWLGLLNFQEVWTMKRTAIERWAQMTMQENVKLYLQEVVSFCDIVEKWMQPDHIMHILLNYMVFELEEDKPTPDEVVEWIKKTDKSIWKDIEYLKEEEIFDTQRLLHKAYDREFLEVLRKDYEKITRILKKRGQSYISESRS